MNVISMIYLSWLQSHHASVFKHEDVHAFLVRTVPAQYLNSLILLVHVMAIKCIDVTLF